MIINELSHKEKKEIVMYQICRVLTSGENGIISREAENIIECWFKTVNPHFGGKTPDECLDMEFDSLLEYINFLNDNYLHSEVERATVKAQASYLSASSSVTASKPSRQFS